jgi:hypothetical protein
MSSEDALCNSTAGVISLLAVSFDALSGSARTSAHRSKSASGTMSSVKLRIVLATPIPRDGVGRDPRDGKQTRVKALFRFAATSALLFREVKSLG